MGFPKIVAKVNYTEAAPHGGNDFKQTKLRGSRGNGDIANQFKGLFEHGQKMPSFGRLSLFVYAKNNLSPAID